MRKILLSVAMAAAAMLTAGTAAAHGSSSPSWSITIGTGGVGLPVGVYAPPPPVVYAPPPPVIYAPPPVVYSPPVVVRPAPVYYAPPPVYRAPTYVYDDGYYAPPRRFVRHRGHRHGHRHHR